MAKKQLKNPADYIETLNMNRLRGRMLRLPPPRGKSREILLVYGHHASLELLFPLAQELNKYGGVTVPDMPGFGGMQSFYHLGEKPTIDNLADYIAAFIKLFYKRRRLTIIGQSFGFVIVTRMLQKYPQLAKKVDLLISEAGFTRHDDFKTKASSQAVMKLNASILSQRLPAALAQQLFLRPFVIRAGYKLMPKERSNHRRQVEEVIELWHHDDLRTHMSTTLAILKLDICNKQVELPLYHLAAANKYFDNHAVEQHLNVIYSSVQRLVAPKSKRKPKPANTSPLHPSIQQLLRKIPKPGLHQ